MFPYDQAKLLLKKRGQLPVYLLHSVTERCNARCSHCFVSKSTCSSNELTIDEIERLCETCGDNLGSVCLTGGEPFLRSDIAQIARAYLAKRSVRFLQICTNGMLTERIVEVMDAVAAEHPTKRMVVNVSIDGRFEAHDRIRGVPNLFARALSTYSELTHLERKRSNLAPSVNITVSRSNEDELVPLFHYLVSEAQVRNITTTLVRGRPSKAGEDTVTPSKYWQLCELIGEHLKSQRLPGYEGTMLDCLLNAEHLIARRRIRDVLSGRARAAPCYAGRLSVLVQSNGDVFPCELRKNKLGNLRETSIDQIWSSASTDIVRREIEGCCCTHENYLLINVLFNSAYLPELTTRALRMKLNRMLEAARARRSNGKRA